MLRLRFYLLGSRCVCVVCLVSYLFSLLRVSSIKLKGKGKGKSIILYLSTPPRPAYLSVCLSIIGEGKENRRKRVKEKDIERERERVGSTYGADGCRLSRNHGQLSI